MTIRLIDIVFPEIPRGGVHAEHDAASWRVGLLDVPVNDVVTELHQSVVGLLETARPDEGICSPRG